MEQEEEWIIKAISEKLKNKEKKIAELFYISKYSPMEITIKLNCSLASIYNSLNIIKIKLYNYIKDNYMIETNNNIDQTIPLLRPDVPITLQRLRELYEEKFNCTTSIPEGDFSKNTIKRIKIVHVWGGKSTMTIKKFIELCAEQGITDE